MAVASNDWTEHLSHTGRFLSVIRDADMTLNQAKCEFAKPEMKFVGRFVGSGNRRPDPQRIQGIVSLGRPQTKKELRRLLGAYGYYRDYILHFAEIAKPLTDLTGKKAPNILVWTDKQQKAFDQLSNCLMMSHVLRILCVGKPFVMHTDASGSAVGAALGQTDENGIEQLLACASQKLSGPQSAWATIEKEAYAIIWALNRFRNVIYGARVVVYSDHNPLQYI